MEVFRFAIEKELVEKGMQDAGQFVRVSNACPCGCAPYPFVSLSDGETGLIARFKSEQELDQFKAQVRVLQMPYKGNCRDCEHLKAVNGPGEKYIGGCELKLRPADCGSFKLAKVFERTQTEEVRKARG